MMRISESFLNTTRILLTVRNQKLITAEYVSNRSRSFESVFLNISMSITWLFKNNKTPLKIGFQHKKYGLPQPKENFLIIPVNYGPITSSCDVNDHNNLWHVLWWGAAICVIKRTISTGAISEHVIRLSAAVVARRPRSTAVALHIYFLYFELTLTSGFLAMVPARLTRVRGRAFKNTSETILIHCPVTMFTDARDVF